VIEIGDANGEFAGKLLAMNGAEVVRVEPPAGGPARRIGPFFQGALAEAGGDPEKSLYHWHYNAGKKGVTLDIETDAGRKIFLDLVKQADIVIESHPPGHLKERALGYDALSRLNPRLILISITEFGADGPWRDFQGSDLVHMALGGQMMMCGYARNAEGVYDTPPIAAQMWHSRHTTGNLAFMHAMAAVMYRDRTGAGQHIKLSVHEATANATEWGLPNALTGIPSVGRRITIPLLLARDGKYVVTHPPTFPGEWDKQVAFLREFGAQGDLDDPVWQDEAMRRSEEGRAHLAEVTERFVAQRDSEEVWVEAQKHDVIWVAVRAPEDNLTDAHFRLRGVTGEVAHPDLGRAFGYPTAPRDPSDLPWLKEPRAPHLGEHNAEILGRAGVTPDRLAELKRMGVV
jgi:crotonobetainyl-CoA:carnitine CoA-transferase CaiB-like acyl-CoA transferase